MLCLDACLMQDMFWDSSNSIQAIKSARSKDSSKRPILLHAGGCTLTLLQRTSNDQARSSMVESRKEEHTLALAPALECYYTVPTV